MDRKVTGRRWRWRFDVDVVIVITAAAGQRVVSPAVPAKRAGDRDRGVKVNPLAIRTCSKVSTAISGMVKKSFVAIVIYGKRGGGGSRSELDAINCGLVKRLSIYDLLRYDVHSFFVPSVSLARLVSVRYTYRRY